MKRLLAACITAFAVLLLCACESMEQALATAAEVMEQNPELIEDEEERERWVSGARVVKSWTREIDTADEIAMGQSLALRAFAGFGEPYPDEDLQRYVASVGRLVALQSERPSLPYSFAVVQSREPNALALPGGYIFVSTGLLKKLESESELACILGHEVCHAARKHGVEIVARDRKIRSLVDFGATLDEEVGKYRDFIDATYRKLTTEGYDRRYEWIADEAGTTYAYRAGYHPEGLLPFLEMSRRSEKPLAFENYKTHPDPGLRISRIRQTLSGLGDYSGMPALQKRYEREVLARLK